MPVLFAVVDDCILCINFQCIRTVSLAFKSKSDSQSVYKFPLWSLPPTLEIFVSATDSGDLQTLHCINLKRLLNQSDRL